MTVSDVKVFVHANGFVVEFTDPRYLKAPALTVIGKEADRSGGAIHRTRQLMC